MLIEEDEKGFVKIGNWVNDRLKEYLKIKKDFSEVS